MPDNNTLPCGPYTAESIFQPRPKSAEYMPIMEKNTSGEDWTYVNMATDCCCSNAVAQMLSGQKAVNAGWLGIMRPAGMTEP